eukprot:7378819-Prymnesium_polylepis.1
MRRRRRRRLPPRGWRGLPCTATWRSARVRTEERREGPACWRRGVGECRDRRHDLLHRKRRRGRRLRLAEKRLRPARQLEVERRSHGRAHQATLRRRARAKDRDRATHPDLLDHPDAEPLLEEQAAKVGALGRDITRSQLFAAADDDVPHQHRLIQPVRCEELGYLQLLTRPQLVCLQSPLQGDDRRLVSQFDVGVEHSDVHRAVPSASQRTLLTQPTSYVLLTAWATP